MRGTVVALLCCLCCAAPRADAADSIGSAWGALSPLGSDSSRYYVEIWGYGVGTELSVRPGGSYAYLAAGSVSASRTALAALTTFSASFRYDPASDPYLSGNGLAWYLGLPPLTVELSGPKGQAATFQLGETRGRVEVGLDGSWQGLGIGSLRATYLGPLSGSNYFYSAPAEAPFKVDLVQMIGATRPSRPFPGLSDFASLPVRLTPPTEFRLVWLSISGLREGPPASFTTALPATFEGQGGAALDMYFDGVYGVTVDAEDFATPEAFQAASAWVSSSIRQINFEQEVWGDSGAFSVTPVPEPGAAALFLAGLTAVLGAARQRRRAL